MSRYLLKQAAALFSNNELQERFVQAVRAASVGQAAIIWTKDRPVSVPFSLSAKPEWCPTFVDLVGSGERPGAYDLHKLGVYYCLDSSSVFCASVLTSAIFREDGGTVLDLCASPGGKGIFAWRLFGPELIVANEPIKKRLGALVSNYKRCQIAPAAVTSFDSSVLVKRQPSSYDIVIVDAPCSGQSLWAKRPNIGAHRPVGELAGAFHPVTIGRNANRQKRIMANAVCLVKPGGYLAYMTCTFSKEENEEIVRWVLRKFPQLCTVEVPSLNEHLSNLTDAYCYRLWPWMGLGAGGFAALFRLSGSLTRSGQVDLAAIKPCWRS